MQDSHSEIWEDSGRRPILNFVLFLIIIAIFYVGGMAFFSNVKGCDVKRRVLEEKSFTWLDPRKIKGEIENWNHDKVKLAEIKEGDIIIIYDWESDKSRAVKSNVDTWSTINSLETYHVSLDQENGKEIAEFYNVPDAPTVVLVTADGNAITKRPAIENEDGKTVYNQTGMEKLALKYNQLGYK